jgi:hypothetical protein
MGRTLNWYIFPGNLEHDKIKQVCLDLEFEPENDDMDLKIKLFNILNPKSDDINDIDYWKKKNEINDLWKSYNWNNACAKCKTYMTGIDGSNSIDAIDISHSYSSPYWKSEWDLKNFHMGSYRTDFVRKFNNNKLYREINKKDIDEAYRMIEELGEPIRTSDKEAKIETLKVLDFLKKYSIIENMHLIMQDEY